MAIEIIIPRLGWSMDEGTFSEWLKKDGDLVSEGEALFVVESDKAAQEVESFDSGILRLTSASPKMGDDVKVGQLIGYLCEEGEAPPDERSSSSSPGSANGHPAVASPSVRRLAAAKGVDLNTIAGTGGNGRIVKEDVELAAVAATLPSATPAEALPAAKSNLRTRRGVSPRAARVAAELGVNLAAVEGTGKAGRIRERDVVAAHRAQGASDPGTNPVTAIVPKSERSRVTPLRTTIAERMMTAVHQAAPVTLTTTVDATRLMSLRRDLNQTHKPSLTGMMVAILAKALNNHPGMTHQWDDGALVIPPDVDISVAVDTEVGLVAPVIRNVDRLSLSEISSQLRALANAAHDRSIKPAELRGGVFTISNLGAARVDAFTPILNLPQSAILGMGRIHKAPMVVDDTLVARHQLALSLTFDHRVIDGGPAARFLDELCELVEHPAAALID